MCDIQVLITPGAVWFAKNSDREPSEPQPVVRFAAVRGDASPTVRATYIDIAQSPDRHGMILSKPAWCWGAEMGINDQGLCIGNEAIFSREASLKPALLGMDLVRLGLERAANCADAIGVIAAYLERYGQGGPAGYQDKSFHYDNSFLVADAREAWVLETAGRAWAARRVERSYAISNQLTLDRGYELCAQSIRAEQPDFAARYDGRLLPWLAGARRRRELSQEALASVATADFGRFARHLRTHRHRRDDPRGGSNADLCMHAAGPVRRSQTTGSMIARLTPAGATALFTGTSAPCLSIFRPAAFHGDFHVLTPESQQIAALLWRRGEWLHRWALADADLRLRLRLTRDEVEARMFELLEPDRPDASQLLRADRLAAAWHKVLFESLDGMKPPRPSRYWLKLGRRDGIDITRRRSDARAGLAAPAAQKETV